MNPFFGEGQIRALLKSRDWSGFALGLPEDWPGPLKTALQLMLDSNQPICLCWGPQLHTFYNDAYAEVIGSRHPGALARMFWDTWPEVRGALEPAMRGALAGTPYFQRNAPFLVMREDGVEECWFTFSLLPIRGEDGQVAGVFNPAVETTDQVQAEQQQEFLLALADRLRLLEDPDAITATANEMLGKQLGVARVFYSEVNDLERTFFIRSNWVREGLSSVAGETRRLDDFGPQVIDTLSSGKMVAINDVLQDPSTAPHAEAYQRIGLRAYLVIPLIRSNRLIGLLSVHSEVPRRWSSLDNRLSRELLERTWAAAENAHAQAELRRAVQRLRQADAHKDQFLALLAHELRNPLAPIRSAAELLQRARLDEALVRKSSDIIARQVQRITGLVDDLMDVSRVARGQVELSKMPLDLRQVVREALEQVNPQLEARSHHLALLLPDDAVMILGDEKRLVQVTANLLSNAAKYTPKGGHIRVSLQAHGHSVMLCVMDDGIGIAPELQERVFDLFAQADPSAKRSGGGLGLGLALVKNIVELHGGAVSCTSEGLGQGSKFTVRLPQLA